MVLGWDNRSKLGLSQASMVTLDVGLEHKKESKWMLRFDQLMGNFKSAYREVDLHIHSLCIGYRVSYIS